MTGKSKIMIGPAGWAYEDWDEVVYPRPRPKDFHGLTYLAQWFDLVEIDSSYYHIPPERNAHSWLAKVRDFPDFRFTAKLWRGFTHERNFNREHVDAFRQFVSVLQQGKKLGCLLAQFPWSFKNSAESVAYLDRLHELFRDFPLCIEVRHDSWLKDTRINDFCAERGIATCNIDQPLLNQCIGATNFATATFAYYRFHGRNSANWFNEKADVVARYDYLYKVDELMPWAESVREILQRVKQVFIVTNNHARGQAIANALELADILDVEVVNPIPDSLVRSYPQLGELKNIKTDDSDEQMELF